MKAGTEFSLSCSSTEFFSAMSCWEKVVEMLRNQASELSAAPSHSIKDFNPLLFASHIGLSLRRRVQLLKKRVKKFLLCVIPKFLFSSKCLGQVYSTLDTTDIFSRIIFCCRGYHNTIVRYHCVLVNWQMFSNLSFPVGKNVGQRELTNGC